MTTRTHRTGIAVALIAFSATALVACTTERHLVGDNDGGALGPGMGSAGNAGTTGTGGAAGATDGGPISSGGTSGTLQPRPLIISAREAARRLAIVIWNQQPDAPLLAEADSGVIQTSQDVGKLALRMLADPRARNGVGAFYRWWLKLDELAAVTKDPMLFPQFTAELRTDLAKESELLGVHVTVDLDGTMDMLLTLPFSFLTERTAAIYGVTGITGPEHRKVALDPAQRAGLLTNPGIMARRSTATRTSPTFRGHFVSGQVLCREIPAPPPDVPMNIGQPTNGTTRQQIVAATTVSPACQGCHNIMDNIGFAYEGLDPIGRFRTTENGLAVDTSGFFEGPSGRLTFTGPRELGQRLTETTDTAVCFTRQWLSFALGREATQPSDASAQQAAYQLFAQSGRNLRQLVAAVVQTDLFLARDSIR